MCQIAPQEVWPWVERDCFVVNVDGGFKTGLMGPFGEESNLALGGIEL